jgi:hypothetical protein
MQAFWSLSLASSTRLPTVFRRGGKNVGSGKLLRPDDYHVEDSTRWKSARVKSTAYYTELGLGMKKKKHGQLPSVKECLSGEPKHLNRRNNAHAYETV